MKVGLKRRTREKKRAKKELDNRCCQYDKIFMKFVMNEISSIL